MLKRPLFAALAMLAAVGCGGAELRPGSLAGTTAFRVMNDVGADASLSRVLISVDGNPIPVTILPPRGALGAPLVSVPMAPGDHQLGVRAAAERKGEVLVVEMQQALRVGATPAAVSIRVFTQSGDLEPLAVSMMATGAALIRPDEMAADPDAGCVSRTPVKLALCRAARSLAEAEQARDIVRAGCILEHLGPMREASDMADSVRAKNLEVALLAEEKALLLAHAVERCTPHSADEEMLLASPRP